MSTLRSVLLLCWRDTGHPQGGGSEAYLQRIGAQLAASGIDVTLRTARYRGAPRREVVDGVTISRGGGPYSVYILAGLAMVAARLRVGTVNVNGGVWYSADAPFGGMRASGIGRESGEWGVREYLEPQQIQWSLA